MDDTETQRQVGVLRGLLYLACPDAPTTALDAAAHAIAERSADPGPPTHASPEAARLALQRPDNDAPRNLTRADLAGAYLFDVNLAKAELTDANLSDAYLFGADLTKANLRGADLTRAGLSNAFLTSANLTDADLTEAVLFHARLDSADLTGAYVTRGFLINAVLTNTILTGTVLTGSVLFGADLTGAVGLELKPGIEWNRGTRWPEGFAERALARSDEISPGTYRVRDGTSPDRLPALT